MRNQSWRIYLCKNALQKQQKSPNNSYSEEISVNGNLAPDQVVITAWHQLASFAQRASVRVAVGIEAKAYRNMDDASRVVAIGTVSSKEAFLRFMTSA